MNTSLKMFNIALVVQLLDRLSFASETIAVNDPIIIKNDSIPPGVVVCDEKSDCDDIKFDWPRETNRSIIIVSSMGGKRFSVTNHTVINDSQKTFNTEPIHINLNTTNREQPILGWGGAFTDATCYLIKKVTPSLGEKLIRSYYGASGLRYNMGRVPIGGSDFSMRSYTYDDTKNNTPDFDLEHWSLASEDLKLKIPVITRALELTFGDLKLFASPWSPPSWMKTSKTLIRGHLINNDLIYDSYAKYLIKFFDEYRARGIEFWGATVQNEPVIANLPFYWFNSLQFSSSEMIRFISKFYGPALRASNRTKDTFKLIVGDDNLGLVNQHAVDILENREAAQYISGLAFHWYLSGFLVSYDKLNNVFDKIGKKVDFFMMSEACTGSMPLSRGVKLGDWYRAENYASDIIEDLWRHTNAWVDWNMVLDTYGGPNWAENFVDSPIIVDTEKNIFYKQPMYYALAHFTTLFPRGCRVLHPNATNSKKGVSYIGCLLDDHVVVTILNTLHQQQAVNISINGLSKISNLTVEAKSLTSAIIML